MQYKTKNKNMKKGIAKKVSLANILTLAAVLLASIVFSQKAQAAANLAQAYIRLDRIKAATATGGTVCAKPTTLSTEAFVQVTFPMGFTVAATPANWTTTATNLPTGATAWPGIGTATAAAGQVVTFPSTDLTVGTLYCFNFSATNTLTTSTAGNDKVGIITTRTSVPADIDTANYAMSIISDDQIVITAVVPPLFSFVLSGNTDAFTANLSTGVVSTTGKTTTITTNASNGWVTWVKSATANGLTSASTGANIAHAATANDDTPTILGANKGYVLDVAITTDSGNGTGTVTQAAGYGAEFNGNDTTSGGSMETTFRPIAASSGTTDGDVLMLTERASITAIQQAATDYTDTITVVSAGRF